MKNLIEKGEPFKYFDSDSDKHLKGRILLGLAKNPVCKIAIDPDSFN